MELKISERVDRIKYAIRDIEVGIKPSAKMIKINIGDPLAYDLKMPQLMVKKICDGIRKGYNFYTDSQGFPPLRRMIAKKEKVSEDDVIITAGTSEGVNFVFSTLLRKGDEILLPSPSYPQYPSMVRLFEGNAKYYNCMPEEEWIPDINEIKRKIGRKTKAIVIINPNNPTGAVYPKDFIEDLSELCADKKVLMIADEIYSDLIFEGKHYSLSKLAKSELILLNGVSKGYLAPGLRIGWMTFHNFKNNDLREGILKLCRLRLCANTPAQYGIAEMMKEENKNGKKHINIIIEKLKKRRDFVMKKFEENNINCIVPKGTFYAFPWIKNEGRWKNDLDFVLKLRDTKKVLIVHGSGFEYKSMDKIFFRIVFLPPIKILDEALDRISEFIRR